jgi:hypothetical protein
MIRPKAGSFKRETVQCDKTNRLAACADAQIRCCSCKAPAIRWRRSTNLSRFAKNSAGVQQLKLFADADHSFHVPALTGRKDAQVFGDALDALSAGVDSVIIPLRKKS